ncbi:MAG TPA: DUF89 family protein [Planctomycetes bacterium]|nr:DUF89 family protein [Planctomycetota bacterium]
MKIYLDCYPCFLRQALEAGRFAGLNQEAQRTVLLGAMDILRALPRKATPPDIANRIHKAIRRLSGSEDPYKKEKEAWTARALELLPRLEGIVREAPDPLEAALRVGVAGNIIDLGPNFAPIDLEKTLQEALTRPFALDSLGEFRQALDRAEWVLLLGDNAGETVFDRVMIPRLGRPVVYAAKGGPILNDATLEDARAAGLDQVARLVSTGCAAAGTDLGLSSPEFRKIFEEAPLILAKGQAQYETLSGRGDKRVFFLLKVKCPVIGRDLGGLETGSLVFTRDR